MEQTLVKSILFYANEDGTPADYMDVKLSTNALDEAFRLRRCADSVAVYVVDLGDREKGETPAEPDESDFAVLSLVAACCADYMNGGAPESLDYWTLALIGTLSDMFDWEGAGYGPETEPGQRANELAIHIGGFYCIG